MLMHYDHLLILLKGLLYQEDLWLFCMCLRIFYMGLVVTQVSFGRNKLQIFTASESNPPGLPLRSRIIFSAPSCFNCSIACFVCMEALLLNCVKTMQPVLSSILVKGTAFTSTSSRITVNWFTLAFIFISIFVFLAPFNSWAVSSF